MLRPEALAFLRGSDLIVHAGDIGNADVLEGLRTLAPVTAVRGNNDTGAWAKRIPQTATVEAGGLRIYVLHDLSELDGNPAGGGFRVVVSGHSHRPSINERDGVLYVNPGSAGPRRFKLPVAAAELRVRGRSVRARIAELEIGL